MVFRKQRELGGTCPCYSREEKGTPTCKLILMKTLEVSGRISSLHVKKIRLRY